MRNSFCLQCASLNIFLSSDIKLNETGYIVQALITSIAAGLNADAGILADRHISASYITR